jgi:enoyl-CoA hydratase/carnithine racemase
MSSDIQFAAEDHVAVITIDRPQVRNAVDLHTALVMAAAIDRAGQSDGIRSIVLTGSGPNFCAGMDLKAFSATG